jgi:uncharacterized membrane protein (DUF106 family)
MTTNSNTNERTEAEMNETSAPIGTTIAGVVTGVVVTLAAYKLMKWNDARKAKKNAQTEN